MDHEKRKARSPEKAEVPESWARPCVASAVKGVGPSFTTITTPLNTTIHPHQRKDHAQGDLKSAYEANRELYVRLEGLLETTWGCDASLGILPMTVTTLATATCSNSVPRTMASSENAGKEFHRVHI